jgi:hypothetical protein
MRFDRMAAVRYAWRYAISYNDNYPYFSYVGGDCTNFVSQVMHAGGWPMIPGARTGDPLAWWANPHPGSSNDIGLINRKLSHTRTWTSVGDFYEHLDSSKRCELCDRDELDLGDIVQMREFGAKHPHHTMVVTNKACGYYGYEVYVSYHSLDKLDVPLAEIEENEKYADNLFICWKVKDIIPHVEAFDFEPEISLTY